MIRLLAIIVCLAVPWLLYDSARFAFVAWYSGVGPGLSIADCTTLLLQSFVNMIAFLFAWRAVTAERRERLERLDREAS